MKTKFLLMLSTMLILIMLVLNVEAAEKRFDNNNNSINPMIIHFESWNPFYGNDGGNASITNFKNVTIKNNMLSPDHPYRVIQKNLTTIIGDVELRNNGTVFKNCLLEGDINGDGEYYIASFELLNQTQIREYYGDSELGYPAVNLSYQEYPELPNIICKFATDSTSIALNDKTKNGDELKISITSKNSLISLVLVIIAAIIYLLTKRLKNKNYY